MTVRTQDTPTLSVSIVIPTLNEARNLPSVVAALEHLSAQVVVVDGGSVDDTVTVARRLLPHSVIVQQTRRGKGNALACGFEMCTGDVIVMIDADGSTNPAEIPAFLDAIENGADFAKGSRFRRGGGSEDITPIRRVGNWFLNALVNVLFGSRFTDLCYGFNAFRRELLPVMDLPSPDLQVGGERLWGDGFEIETLINVRVARSGAEIVEVPSVEKPRLYGESNLDAVRDGLRVLRTIAVERTRRPRLHAVAAPTIDLTDRPIRLEVRDEQASVDGLTADVAS